MLRFYSLLAAALCSLANFSYAQHTSDEHLNCGKNPFTEAFFEAHPGEEDAAEAATRALKEFTQDYISAKDGEDDDIIIIPVVFHVVHVGGEENISDDQIYSAVEVLNEDFNAANDDIGDVVDEFADIVGNVQFEFRLAKKDPQGNCTNGINRVFSATTFDGDSEMKQIAQTWGRESYLNIWVCAQIGNGVAGYAFLPGSVNGSLGASIDGIVILHEYVGRIGTSNATRSHALSHEVGHWANLEHTWGSSNTPGQASNCNDDDGISDTPPTTGWFQCDLGGETCGSLDNVENFMDYSYCYKMFTEGQKNFMRAALNSPIAQRNQVHTTQNLQDTGVLDEDVICSADFIVDRDPTICADQAITFDDISYNGVENRTWEFEGGNPSTSSEDSPTVTYSTPGTYSVSLTVSNASGEESITRTDYVHVLEAPQYGLPFQEGFEDLSTIEENDKWVDINADGSNIRWKITDEVSYSGDQCAYVQGRSNEDFQIEILESPTFDLSGLEDNAVLSFKYAHARRTFSSDDYLRGRISKDCGETWNQREYLDIDELPTVSSYVTGQFIPDAEDDWREVVIDNISSIFLNEEFRVRFEFMSVNGNNIFIDDINLYDPNTLSVDNSEVVKNITLFPNPATDRVRLRIELEENQNIRIDVLDASGRVVQSPFNGTMAGGVQGLDIDLGSSLASGIYFIRLTGEEGIAVRKLVIE
jgi:PKD repeat protein